jgi:MFS family permease
MSQAIELFRNEPRARVFFAVLTQSALGTGAGYIALLLLAYERFRSPWAISLVLIADLVPAMLLGPVFGAAADRWSRRGCLVAADLVRAIAFAAIALVHGFAPTLALALVAGAGTGLFTPAALAGLPSLVAKDRLPAATSVYGAIADLGFTAGPAIAALILLFGGPESIMLLNGATFLISSVVLTGLRFGEAPSRGADTPAHRSLLHEAREGLWALAGMSGTRIVVLATAALLFFGGLFNVAELLFATQVLDAGDPGYAVLVSVFGLGFIVGSLAGSRGGEPPELKRRYLAGLAVMSCGFLLSGVAPVLGLALVTFGAAGFGNGLVLVYERLLIQTTTPDRLMGRIFGIKDALTAWAFGLAFVSAGGLISLIEVRPLIVVAGIGGLAVWACSIVALRNAWPTPSRPVASLTALASRSGGDDAEALRDLPARKHSPNVVGGRGHWLALLDDLQEGADDSGVELGPRIGH